MSVDLLDFTSQSSPEDVDIFRPPPILSLPSPPQPLRFLPTDDAVLAPRVSPKGYVSSPAQSEFGGPSTSHFSTLDLCRRARARDQNFRHSSIHKLSPDILGTVFEYVCLSRPKKAWQRPFCPTTLASICAYWHDVAWSTPRVWTHLRLDYAFWRAAGRNRLVKLCVQNSRGMGLHIEIRNAPMVDGREGSMGIPGGDVFDTLFVKYPHKPESLDFRVYVGSWLFHIGEISRMGGLINLERLRIRDNRDMVPVPGTSFSIYNLPSLNRLILDGLGGPLTCPWNQVVDLILSVIPSDDAFNAIRLCTNLRTLRCIGLKYQDIWQPDVIPDAPLTFPHLKKIVWESTVPLSASWNEALVRWFHFPSLNTLVFNMPITVVKRSTSILLNLPKSVTSLSLNVDLRNVKEARTCIARGLRNIRAANREILRRILTSSPSLTTLTLQCEPSIDPGFIDVLALRSSQADLAPCLRELVFVTESPCNSEAFLSLLRVVGTRWSTGYPAPAKRLESVGLVVPTVESVQRLPRAFVDGMGAMVQQGLKMNVYVKGEGKVDINWLAPYRDSEEDYSDDPSSSSPSE